MFYISNKVKYIISVWLIGLIVLNLFTLKISYVTIILGFAFVLVAFGIFDKPKETTEEEEEIEVLSDEEMEEELLSDGEFTYDNYDEVCCPECGEFLGKGVYECESCGWGTEKLIEVCPSCGRENEDKLDFCTYCDYQFK